jgi:alcohol dehydrogenase class IV
MASDGLLPLPGHPRAFAGRGAAARLRPTLDDLGATRVLVVHGVGAARRDAVAATIDGIRGGRTVACFAGVTPNPNLRHARAAVAAARMFRPDAVVGIGGGSTLDVAKIAALFGDDPHGAGLDDPTCLRPPDSRRTSLVLVPTVSGSGSELTRFATIYADGVKRSVDHAAARADVVLVDPDLTATVPVRVGIPAALDALAQAAESYWSVRATPASRSLAHEALRRLAPMLGVLRDTAAFADPGVRAELAIGAAWAGAAIDLTRTTAAHALSYPLTAHRGLAHGTAVALHLRWLLPHHAHLTDDCRHPGGAAALRSLAADIDTIVRHGCGSPPEALVSDLLAAGGQPGSLAELALRPDVWGPVFDAALASDRAGNNPSVLTLETVLVAATTC